MSSGVSSDGSTSPKTDRPEEEKKRLKELDLIEQGHPHQYSATIAWDHPQGLNYEASAFCKWVIEPYNDVNFSADGPEFQSPRFVAGDDEEFGWQLSMRYVKTIHNDDQNQQSLVGKLRLEFSNRPGMEVDHRLVVVHPIKLQDDVIQDFVAAFRDTREFEYEIDLADRFCGSAAMLISLPIKIVMAIVGQTRTESGPTGTNEEQDEEESVDLRTLRLCDEVD